MQISTIYLNPEIILSDIDPRLYGNFVEHLGRCVYGGIYEPGHPTADVEGFRGDVIEMTKELQIPIVRYPGGNFVSSYNWEDGVGPRHLRPRRLDPGWKVTETNQLGTNEFIDWCRKIGTEPLMAVNLGTRGIDDARRLLEYCNHPSGTALSDLRASHGYPEPHRIKTWCLGNEMDGPWQTGHKTADEYGRLAAETGRVMKQMDDKLELVVCGSCGPYQPTYPEWDRVVLEHTYEQADFLSVHLYLNDINRSVPEYLASTRIMEDQLRTTLAACDFVKTKLRSKKNMMLCFDEWNVWDWNYMHPKDFKVWQEAPSQVEQSYRMLDAIVFGGMLITLLKHASRVRIACVAQLVNVIGPIMTETGGKAWKQPIFYPLYHGSKFGRGEVVHLHFNSPSYETKEFGNVPYLDAVATRDPLSGDISIFAINRHLETSLPFLIQLEGGTSYTVYEHLVLEHSDPNATNSPEHPEQVKPHNQGDARADKNQIKGHLAPLSWNVLRLKKIT